MLRLIWKCFPKELQSVFLKLEQVLKKMYKILEARSQLFLNTFLLDFYLFSFINQQTTAFNEKNEIKKTTDFC